MVRAEIRKAAVSRQTDGADAGAAAVGRDPAGGSAGLIWGLFHDTSTTIEAIKSFDDSDLDELGGAQIFEVARSLQHEATEMYRRCCYGV